MEWSEREARREDEPARAAVMRTSLADNFLHTCMYFFWQELTLQCCVLGAAVLFIFCHCGALACALPPAAAAALVALAVRREHWRAAAAHAQTMRSELTGWVAEVREMTDRGAVRRLVGTVSVHPSGRVRALCVLPAWRRRGVARGLLRAVRRRALALGMSGLRAAVSELQPHARACLQAAGWQLSSTWHRHVVGSALTLPVALMQLDLPPPA